MSAAICTGVVMALIGAIAMVLYGDVMYQRGLQQGIDDEQIRHASLARQRAARHERDPNIN
jgi:hypothetical protein